MINITSGEDSVEFILHDPSTQEARALYSVGYESSPFIINRHIDTQSLKLL